MEGGSGDLRRGICLVGQKTTKSLAFVSRSDFGTFGVRSTDGPNATVCCLWDGQQKGDAIKRSKSSSGSRDESVLCK